MVQLGEEHDAAEWLPPEEASVKFSWPRSVTALGEAIRLIGRGHAGEVEDVLRVI
jgi:hypothetical protein